MKFGGSFSLCNHYACDRTGGGERVRVPVVGSMARSMMGEPIREM
jgi:hypothetical protein